MRISDWSSDVCSSDLRSLRYRVSCANADYHFASLTGSRSRPFGRNPSRSGHARSGRDVLVAVFGADLGIPGVRRRPPPEAIEGIARIGFAERLLAVGREVILRPDGRSEEHTSELPSL